MQPLLPFSSFFSSSCVHVSHFLAALSFCYIPFMCLFHLPCPKANGLSIPQFQSNVMFDSSHVPLIEGPLILYSMFTAWGNLFCKEARWSHAVSFNPKSRLNGLSSLYSFFTVGFINIVLYSSWQFNAVISKKIKKGKLNSLFLENYSQKKFWLGMQKKNQSKSRVTYT